MPCAGFLKERSRGKPPEPHPSTAATKSSWPYTQACCKPEHSTNFITRPVSAAMPEHASSHRTGVRVKRRCTGPTCLAESQPTSDCSTWSSSARGMQEGRVNTNSRPSSRFCGGYKATHGEFCSTRRRRFSPVGCETHFRPRSVRRPRPAHDARLATHSS
jgi:hypothetical protein